MLDCSFAEGYSICFTALTVLVFGASLFIWERHPRKANGKSNTIVGWGLCVKGREGIEEDQRGRRWWCIQRVFGVAEHCMLGSFVCLVIFHVGPVVMYAKTTASWTSTRVLNLAPDCVIYASGNLPCI
jgi:hypothetical protein